MKSKVCKVFDVGANCGDKAQLFGKVFDTVLCIEPDPAAAQMLRNRFRNSKKICVLETGAGSTEGYLEFFQISKGNPLNTFSSKWIRKHGNHPIIPLRVPMTTLEKLIALYGVPNYIKIDVEGFEVEVLRGLRTAVETVSFECNLPEFVKETEKCVQLLSKISGRYFFNYTDGDAVQFALKEWMPADQFLNTVRHFNGNYMEIYARLHPQQLGHAI